MNNPFESLRPYPVFAALFLAALPAFAQNSPSPKLDLQVKQVECAPDFTSWRFEIVNYGSSAVSLSDLEVRLWVHGAGPLETHVWEPGRIVLADGSESPVSQLTIATSTMARYIAYPPGQRADTTLSVTSQEQGVLPPGAKWLDALFEYHFVNWGPLAPLSGYTNSNDCGTDSSYTSNPTVGLYDQGALLTEWESAGSPDPQTGASPLPALDFTPVPTPSTQITSPSDGEQVCGLVRVVVRPTLSTWSLQCGLKGCDDLSWKTLPVSQASGYWCANWDTTTLAAGDYQLRLWSQAQGTAESVTVKVGYPQVGGAYPMPDSGVPGGIAPSSMNLFVLDGKAQDLLELGPQGGLLQTLGGWGNRLGEFNQPLDVAVDSKGTPYVADTGNGRVQSLGDPVSLLGGSFITYPLAVKATGNGLFVLDGKSVHRFDPSGNYLYSGALDAAGVYQDIAVDEGGLVYAVNAATQTIDLYGPDFTKQGSWSLPSGGWSALSISYSEGRFWVVDQGHNQVLKLGPDGNVLASWGGYGSAMGQFDQPYKAATDGQGSLYVSDPGNNRIQKFLVSGGPTPGTTASATPGALVISGLSAQPNPFNPSLSSSTLSYALSADAQVHLALEDSKGNLLYQVDFPSGNMGGKAGTNQFTWNGLESGLTVPPGSYTALLQASANGQQATAQYVWEVISTAPSPTAVETAPPSPTSTQVVVLTPTPTPPAPSPTPVVPTNTTVPPTPSFTPVPPTATFTPVPPTATFTPVEPLKIQDLDLNPEKIDRLHGPSVVALSFQLNEKASVTIELESASGAAVATAALSGQTGPNSYNFTCPGIGNASTAPPAGNYRFVVTATSTSGSTASATADFTITP